MLLPGTYSTASGQTFPIYLKPGVRLEGYEGAAKTVISGDGHVVIAINDPAPGSAVVGLTITQATAQGDQGITITRPGGGGALEGWPLISECVIEGCRNINSTGGALRVDGIAGSPGAPRIEYTTVRGNVADEGGGAYFGRYSNATVYECTFEGNSAYRGGGICTTTEYALRVYSSRLLANEADGPGGGLSASIGGGELLVFSGEIRDNTAQTGGGIDARACNPIYDSLTIAGNTASQRGGGTYHSGATPTFSNCLIAGNSASLQGGASYNDDRTVVLNYCTIADNIGGTWAGVYADHALAADAEIYDSTLWGHGGQDVHGATAVEYSDTQDTNLGDDMNSGVANVIHANPLFVNAPDGYRISPDSPCIDTADPLFIVGEDAFGTERPQDGDGNSVAVPDMGFHEYKIPEVERYFGADRYETAVDAALSFWSASEHAIIASGENFPDALSAAGLAGAWQRPLLLVRKDSVPAVVAQALVDLGVQHTTIIGGTAAISDDVMAEVHGVRRIAGVDRYETAVAVAREIHETYGSEFSKTAFLARGDAFPDALAASPLAYRGSAYGDGLPIVLTRPDALPAATAGWLASADVETVHVIGREVAITPTVKSALDSILVSNGGAASTRIFGADRYATAVALAEAAPGHSWGWWQRVGVATGANFPDALGGGAIIRAQNGVLLLTAGNVLSAPTAGAIDAHLPDIQYVDIFGGEVAVSAAVRTAIEEALGL
jgi:predicted outer membrane repeat protein